MDTQIRLLDACELFALDNAARHLTPATQSFYTSSLRLFVAWCAGEGVTLLEDVTPVVIRRFLVDLQARSTPRKQPLTSSYIHNLTRAVRRFCAFCVTEELLPRTPFRSVQMPRVERKVLLCLTPEEIERVLRACDSLRDKAFVSFLLDTGVRAGEACSLTVGAVDLQSGAVLVTKGKGQKGRFVYVGIRARKGLRRYLLSRGSLTEGAPLFHSLRSGGPLTVNAVVQLMRRLRNGSGVRYLSAHALRRTFAIACLRNGMDLHTLRVLMGHTDVEMLRQYLDFAQSDLQAAHARNSPLDHLTA